MTQTDFTTNRYSVIPVSLFWIIKPASDDPSRMERVLAVITPSPDRFMKECLPHRNELQDVLSHPDDRSYGFAVVPANIGKTIIELPLNTQVFHRIEPAKVEANRKNLAWANYEQARVDAEEKGTHYHVDMYRDYEEPITIYVGDDKVLAHDPERLIALYTEGMSNEIYQQHMERLLPQKVRLPGEIYSLMDPVYTIGLKLTMWRKGKIIGVKSFDRATRKWDLEIPKT